MKLRTTMAGLAAATIALLGTPLAGTAGAATLNCGATVMQSTTLDADVGPCGQGITIGADNVTLDLAGHTIRGGVGNSANVPGVRFNATTGSKVVNGTVTGFGAGVSIELGGNNVVHDVRAFNNLGGNDYGDGIFCFQSDGNRILHNDVVSNGAFSGITLDDCSSTLVDRNGVRNNTLSTAIGIWILNDRDVPASQGDVDLVGRQASFNVVSNNSVEGNALDGIQVSRFAHDNTVQNNTTSRNGTTRTNGVRDGNGIAVFGNHNLVQDNFAFQNGANGIVVFSSVSNGRPQGANNTLLRNRAQGNDIGPNTTPSFDLRDQNPTCDNNQWHANMAATASPSCTLNP